MIQIWRALIFLQMGGKKPSTKTCYSSLLPSLKVTATAPKKWADTQKESSNLPTINFQGWAVSFRECNLNIMLFFLFLEILTHKNCQILKVIGRSLLVRFSRKIPECWISVEEVHGSNQRGVSIQYSLFSARVLWNIILLWRLWDVSANHIWKEFLCFVSTSRCLDLCWNKTSAINCMPMDLSTDRRWKL